MNVEDATAGLLERLRAGDGGAIGELFERHRERLWRMLMVRMDARLSARLSPDDVLQDAFLDVARRAGEYLANPAVPFYVWLRFLTLQRLQTAHRAHLGAAARDAALEVSSGSMADRLVGDLTSPSQAAIRGELCSRLRAALDEMEPLDREVLALRHFEELGNAEAAQVLGISKDAASKRHVRALKRLRDILEGK